MSNKTNTKVVLKELSGNDLGKVAQVHLDSFSQSALTKLGTAIVQRYYLWQLTGPHKDVRAVGAFVDDDCAGFSFSGVFNGSTAGFLEQNKSFLIKQVLFRPWLILNPVFLKKMLYGVNALRRFNKKQKTPQKNPQIKSLPFGILSIAVSNKYQKLGIGKILLHDAEQKAVKCGFEQIELTVNPGNRNAVKFYENLDWKKSPPGEKWKGYMVKMLKQKH